MVHATWPQPAGEPYAVSIATGSGDTPVETTFQDREFDRFAELTSALLQVSKTELDEKLKES